MIPFKQYFSERSEKDVTMDELENVYRDMHGLISKAKRSNTNAANLWHDVILADKGIDWFNDTILPEYEKAKYPKFASPEYGVWQRKMVKKYIRK